LTDLKLTIELVPKSSWMNNVRAVLTTTQWNALRGVVCDAAYNVCEICGGVGPKHPVECHEIWHYNEKTKVRKLTGMLALCPDCHMVKHIGLAGIQGKGELALKHLMQINKMKKKEAEAYITKAFETWKDRSKLEWTLDLSILKRYGIDPDKLKEPK
jgi:hypothetical protein